VEFVAYYFERRLDGAFDTAVAKVREALAAQGFGIITEINVTVTLKEKLGVDFRPYIILGACNPSLAYEALMEDDKVGVMLPCNVIVQAFDDGGIQVAAIDPVTTMKAAENGRLEAVAQRVSERLKAVITSLS
jgi:uncharacterized protein (DUF302 family)